MGRLKAICCLSLSALLLVACGNEESEQNVETSKKVQVEEQESEEETVVVETVSEELDDNLFNRTIKQEDFIYGQFGKVTDFTSKINSNSEDEETTGIWMENSYHEWVGFNYSEGTLHFIIRNNSPINDYWPSAFSFSAITDASEEVDIDLTEMHQWRTKDYQYTYYIGIPSSSDKVIRLDYLTGEISAENSDVELKESVTIAELKNDSEVEKSIEDFEFHQLGESNFSDEKIVFETDEGLITVNKIDYLVSQSLPNPTLSIDLEITPNTDSSIDATLILPTRDFEEIAFDSVDDTSFFKDIPKQLNVNSMDLPFLYLEDSFILKINGESKYFSFKNGRFDDSAGFKIFTFGGVTMEASKIKNIDYALRHIEGVSSGEAPTIEATYISQDGTEEIKQLNEKSGEISITEDVEEITLSTLNYIEGFEHGEVIDYHVKMKDPDVLLNPKMLQ